MGYTLKIGQRVVEKDGDGEYDNVEKIELADAPADGSPTDRTNERWPSYSGWGDFTEETGLNAVFFDKEKGLLREHPGCVPITEWHRQEVNKAASLGLFLT